jgi:hypothetical protein
VIFGLFFILAVMMANILATEVKGYLEFVSTLHDLFIYLFISPIRCELEFSICYVSKERNGISVIISSLYVK